MKYLSFSVLFLFELFSFVEVVFGFGHGWPGRDPPSKVSNNGPAHFSRRPSTSSRIPWSHSSSSRGRWKTPERSPTRWSRQDQPDWSPRRPGWNGGMSPWGRVGRPRWPYRPNEWPGRRGPWSNPGRSLWSRGGPRFPVGFPGPMMPPFGPRLRGPRPPMPQIQPPSVWSMPQSQPPTSSLNFPSPSSESFNSPPPPPTFRYILPAPTQQVLFTSYTTQTLAPRTLPLREIIENAEIATHMLFEPSPFVPAMIHNRLDMMHSLKQSLFNAAGIGGTIDAPDDGTFWTDILLSDQQSSFLLNHLGSYKRKRRYAIFLEGFPAYKWDITRPIPYSFDANVASHERTIVQSALRQIESKTCIRFQYYPARPSVNYIYYTKMSNPALCGLSYIGRKSPANPVYLSFSCPDFMGVVIHETMHALGVNHHHQRNDRDHYIRINWENIDPTKYDYFAVADPSIFTSYGVPYDYYSIMAYSPKIGTLPPYNRPSVTPLRNPQQYLSFIGQRRFISNGDAELLNKMYCKPASCVDRNVYCGAWANLNLCRRQAQYGWMQQNCQKSCGFC